MKRYTFESLQERNDDLPRGNNDGNKYILLVIYDSRAPVRKANIKLIACMDISQALAIAEREGRKSNTSAYADYEREVTNRHYKIAADREIA